MFRLSGSVQEVRWYWFCVTASLCFMVLYVLSSTCFTFLWFLILTVSCLVLLYLPVFRFFGG